MRIPQSPQAVSTQAITLGSEKQATFLSNYPAAETDPGAIGNNQEKPQEYNPPVLTPTLANQIPFPFSNFTYFFTLFSKCFSSFHHCTCLLSVSLQYLALEGIYLPLRAAFPNNSTLRKGLTYERRNCHTGFSPSMMSCSKERKQYAVQKSPIFKLQREYLHKALAFKFELFPLHSPLLGESLLVSFPPLIDMLKFSGQSYLI